MKLDISFKDGHPVIVDDRGEAMPCIRRVRVDYEFTEAPEITIVVLADGDRVTLAASDDGPSQGA